MTPCILRFLSVDACPPPSADIIPTVYTSIAVWRHQKMAGFLGQDGRSEEVSAVRHPRHLRTGRGGDSGIGSFFCLSLLASRAGVCACFVQVASTALTGRPVLRRGLTM